MNTQEKSLKLAELMGWEMAFDGKVIDDASAPVHLDGTGWQPYMRTRDGLAQFAAILLKFPEVMLRVEQYGSKLALHASHHELAYERVTQTTLLDEILRMNGVDV